MFTLEMFIHLDAVDRKSWTGAPDDRPLTELGERQAEQIVEALTAGPIDALVSSAALRCPESLGPLSKATGLEIEIMPGFRDTLGYRAPDGWGKQGQPDPLGGAQSAGSAFAALNQLRERFPDGRVVLCSYGDIIPALLAFLSGQYGVDMPPNRREKGAVFIVKLDGGAATLTTQDPPSAFPQ